MDDAQYCISELESFGRSHFRARIIRKKPFLHVCNAHEFRVFMQVKYPNCNFTFIKENSTLLANPIVYFAFGCIHDRCACMFKHISD